MKKYILLFLILVTHISYAQNNKQNIRGTIIDNLSLTPLQNAVIKISNTSENNVAQSDVNGNYVIENINPGRYEIKISLVGYKNIVVPNIVVSSGKESILDIKMDEDLLFTEAIEVNVNEKDKTINDLVTNSARTFSMEEVNRYSGSRNDPARLVSNFAGVNTPDDSRNDIVIRGNSPVGVLWRIDGMNVTNPNHFASVGSTGGAVSALNTNLLKNSDFFTSAFPSEYGNAISGVFDLGFRNGNTKKRETSLQLGVITGLEAVTEGPINKNNGSSYLIGYRYSLAGIVQSFGVDIGTPSTPSYQDLSFKINSGKTKLGTFSTFGIIASSNISLKGDNSTSLYGNGNDADFSSKIRIVGLNHLLLLNSKSFISSSIGLNYTKTEVSNYDLDSARISFLKEESNTRKAGYNFITNYNAKINSRLFVKLGFQAEYMDLYLFDRTKRNQRENWVQVWDYNSNTTLAQTFAHIKYDISEKFVLNTGLHAQKFFLNNSVSVEPRLGIIYNVNSNSSFSLAYGLHSMMQPLNIYFLQTQNPDGSYNYINKNLDFTKSNHFVLGYDLQPLKDWRIKAEVYYQDIFNVPVNNYSSSYSMLNTGATFKTDLEDSLVNKGTGKNYGAELTVEKFFSAGYYGLFTVSVYKSKYTASDGIERNTAFNGSYVYNILGGKEWEVGSSKINKLTADFKITGAGGRPYTPIDLLASEMTGKEQLQSNSAYTEYYSNYFRIDLKVGYTINSSTSKLSQSFSLDLQNVTNNKNVFSQTYDNGNKSIKTTYQLGLFPNFVYKLQF